MHKITRSLQTNTQKSRTCASSCSSRTQPKPTRTHAHTRLRMHARTKHTCTPLCANYLSSTPIWLGCTACSPWARPVDIQAEINTSQLLGARDILVINSCVGLYNRDPRRPSRTGCFISDFCLSGEGWKRSEEILCKRRRWETWRGEAIAPNPIPSPARRPWLCPAPLVQHLQPQLQNRDRVFQGFLNA